MYQIMDIKVVNYFNTKNLLEDILPVSKENIQSKNYVNFMLIFISI